MIAVGRRRQQIVGAEMRTKVGIVGAGPAGLFLSLLLNRAGIDNVVVEARSRAYAEGRVRAGVLEQHSVDLMRELGVAARLERESMVDRALDIRFNNKIIHFSLPGLANGKAATIYGQQEVVKDLIAARVASGTPLLFEAEAVSLEGIDGTAPTIRCRHQGADLAIECDFIAGCDGFHGVSRPAIPEHVITAYDRIFPFGWLGILSESPPLKEMTYANHERGFALASRRSPQISRLYVQCAADEDLDLWPDQRIWDELHIRLAAQGGDTLREGRIFQKGVTPVRAFVAAPMQYGRLFLAGDAAHIVPPTGAKGLNLATADVRILSRALDEFYRTGKTSRLDRYSEVCLQRVWKAVRFSNYMTGLLHRFDSFTPFERQIQVTELEYIYSSVAAQTVIAENYVGLPFSED
jgi:p-hydroxybenzoate 3-monooxygenase